MSSICSVNSCTSPDVTSSNVSSNQVNGSVNNEAAAARLRSNIPEVKKDNKYWERRRRNNEAARRSREKRRMNDMNMDSRILELAQRNKQLEQELLQMKMGTGTITGMHTTTPFDTSNKKTKLTPIIPATENNKDKIQTTLLNGMVFPIFTTIKPVNNHADCMESPIPSILSNGCQISIHNEHNRFPTNLLTLSNIPLLSNLISTSNFNDDIVSKPTLLLPPFQIPTKTVDSDSSNTADLAATTDSVADDFTTEIEKSSKTEINDILDLRMKHEKIECMFAVPDELSSVFETVITNSHDVKDYANHINNNGDIHSVDEPINNSFLLGSVETDPCKGQSLVPMTCNDTSERYCYNKYRRQRISADYNGNCYRAHRKHVNGVHVINQRSRLQIREEVAKVVSKENGKLHEAIDSLGYEIKQLKSVLLSITASSTTPIDKGSVTPTP